jgi:cell wall-associated NlpC family hydrolase
LSALRPLLRALIVGAVVVGIAAPMAAAQADPTVSDIQQQIDKSSADFEHTVDLYNKSTELVAATQAEANQLALEMQPLQASLDVAYAQVGQIAATAYKNGGVSNVRALLSTDSPEILVYELSSINQLARTRQRDIETYTGLKKEYDAHKARLDTLLAQQTAQQKELAAKKATIEADLAKLYDMRTKAYGSPTAPAEGGYTGAVPNVSGQAGVAVRFAYGAIGTPYVFAGTGTPSNPGYDCSGLTMMAWKAAGVSLAHGAADQYSATARIPRSALAPGDLVFYNGLGHVGIYVGNNQIIHAAQPGTNVALASVDMMTPDGYGRVA